MYIHIWPSIADLSLRNPMRTVQHSDPLSLAVAHFAKGVHRVCVIGPEGKVSAILSQSAVARWLEANVW
jgi:CBS-domain-containing membrane protein